MPIIGAFYFTFPDFPLAEWLNRGILGLRLMGSFLQQHWRMLLEVILMGGALLYAWLFLRRSSGARLLPAVLLLVLALVLLAHALQMELVRTFAFFVGVTLVIIFQPEMRRSFVSLGSHRLFSSARENMQLVEALEDRLTMIRNADPNMVAAATAAAAAAQQVRTHSDSTPTGLEKRAWHDALRCRQPNCPDAAAAGGVTRQQPRHEGRLCGALRVCSRPPVIDLHQYYCRQGLAFLEIRL